MKKELPYYFLPILVVLNSILAYSLTPSVDGFKGISPDSLDYITIAQKLPTISNSLFPVFYPICIKLVSFLFNNYFLASKILCCVAVIFSFGFVYRKNFFWREFWIILSTSSFLDIYYWSWSETILIPELIVFYYYIQQYFQNKCEKNWLLKISIILILLLLTKYSSIFIIIGMIFFVVLMKLVYHERKYKLISPIIISLFFFLGYIFLNFHFTGYFTGNRITRASGSINIQLSLFNIIYAYNPIINNRFFCGVKINYLYYALFTILIFLPSVYLLVKNKIKDISEVVFCFSISIIFLLFSYASFFITKLDYLNERLLLPSIFFLYVGLIIGISQFISKKTLIIIGYLSLIFNLIDNIYHII
ncbi:MAG: hypothetical protein JST62_14495 [Bacteroidetes bacterium]|nr:hypothetical protein [Bacteroidota bacterium]